MRKNYSWLVKFQKFLLAALLIPLLAVFTANSVYAQGATLRLEKTIKPVPNQCNVYEVTLSATGERVDRPIESILVMDVSGSMDDPIDGDPNRPDYYVRKAAKEFVRKMFQSGNNPTGKNKVGLVIYGTYGRVKSVLSDNEQRLLQIIDNEVYARDEWTNISDGIDQARELFEQNNVYRCNTVRNIVVLTDGLSNRTGHDSGSLRECEGMPTSMNECTRAAVRAGQRAQTTNGRETFVYSVLIQGAVGWECESTGHHGGYDCHYSEDREYMLEVARETMDGIQNTDGVHESRTGSDLVDLYNQIFEQIRISAKDITVSDRSDFNIDSQNVEFNKNPENLSVRTNNFQGTKYIQWNLKKIILGQRVDFSYRMTIPNEEGCGSHTPSGRSTIAYEAYSQSGSCAETDFQFPDATYCVPCADKSIPVLRQGDCANKIEYEGTITEQGACSDVESTEYKWEFYADGTLIKTIGAFDLSNVNALSGEVEIPLQYFRKGVRIKAVLATKIQMRDGGCMRGETSKILTLTNSGDIELVCKGAQDIEGCSTDAIADQLGYKPYSTGRTKMTEREFKAEVESVSNTCFINTYEYQDTKTGTCPIVVTREYTVTDKSGKRTSCQHTININRTDFRVPSDGASTVDCASKAIQPTPPIVSDACGEEITPVVKTTPPNVSCFGTMVWVFTYRDCAGHAHDWRYTYTVEDRTQPTVTCPGDQTKIIAQGATEYTVAGTEFDIKSSDVSDNCTDKNDLVFTNNLNNRASLAGYRFSKGETNVTWTVRDACNNISECTFKVQVISPDIAVVKSATVSAFNVIGDVITYDISVTNNSGTNISNVVVNDANADQGSIKYVSGDDGDKVLENNETWRYEARHTITQDDLNAKKVTNTATVTGQDENGNPVTSDSNTVVVNLTNNAIKALNDDMGSVNGAEDTTTTKTVFDNDTLNGAYAEWCTGRSNQIEFYSNAVYAAGGYIK